MLFGTTSRRLVLASVSVIIATTLAVWLEALRWSEPTFQGKKLSFWLDQYGHRSSKLAGEDSTRMAMCDQARDAIRAIGSNAIPHLLTMLREVDSVPTSKWREWTRKAGFPRLPSKPAPMLNSQAVDGFEVLGADAKGAVLEIVMIHEQNLSPSSRVCAVRALGAIGPGADAAIPLLFREISDTNSPARVNATYALGQIHSNPDLVIPRLITCLDDANRGVQLAAIRALGSFGTNAQQAIPALFQLLNGNDKGLRPAAQQAVGEIRQK